MSDKNDIEKEAILAEQLITHAKDGNMDAFGDLYDIYLPRIYRYCFARVRNTAEAEDLAVEAELTD